MVGHIVKILDDWPLNEYVNLRLHEKWVYQDECSLVIYLMMCRQQQVEEELSLCECVPKCSITFVNNKTKFLAYIVQVVSKTKNNL